MRRKIVYNVFFCVVVLLPYIGLGCVVYWYKGRVKKIERAAVLIADKEKMTLSVVDYQGVEKARYQMACGKNYGNKQEKGDMKTPEGVFHVDDVQDASSWTHDFNDGNGEVAGAYGPVFIRLEVPGHSGIGIHGTHRPESIGARDTEGCIRLKNEDILELKKKVYVGMPVIIIPSKKDVAVMLPEKMEQKCIK